jgi:hypothetical protein
MKETIFNFLKSNYDDSYPMSWGRALLLSSFDTLFFSLKILITFSIGWILLVSFSSVLISHLPEMCKYII